MIGFYGTITAGTGVIDNSGRTLNKWIGQIPTTVFGNRAWYASTNTYKGLLNYYPTKVEATGVSNNSGVQWSWFMPKWQPDDYYENNFRINKFDTVQMFYKDSCTAACATLASPTFSSGGAVTIDKGATALVASIGIAFAAAALTF